MSELILNTSHKRVLKPLVKTALENQLRLVELGIQRSRQRLAQSEQKYGMTTEVFLQKYESNQMEETLELAEWIGEYRLLNKLNEKAEALREVTIEN